MANSSENSQINESAIVENDQGIIAVVNPAIDKLQSNVITLEDNEFPVVERRVKGTVVSIIRVKHFGFIKRKDKVTARDVFAREASIINQGNHKKFFVGDLCRFDIIKTTRGLEAVNIEILERNITPIRNLPKIPKKSEVNLQQQSQVPGDIFRSTIAEIFREVLKKKN